MQLSTDDALSQDVERTRIDEQLLKLEAQMHALKLRRNEIAGPISRIPAEVVALIFFWVGRNAPHLPEGQRDKIAWLHALCCVCHVWREIVLGEPRLWSDIDVTKVSRTEAMIERAKAVPLRVEANFVYARPGLPRFGSLPKHPGAPSSDAVRYALTRMSHISHLTISASFRMLNDLLQKIVVEPKPTLRRLALHSVHPHWSMQLSAGHQGHQEHHDRIQALDDLFRSSFINLQTLELSNIIVPWSSLKGLRLLEIRDGSPSAQPPLYDWCEALRRMPELERLVLIRSGPKDYTVEHTTVIPPDPDQIVELPRLTHFTITNIARDTSYALEHLSLPSIQNLTINCVNIGYKSDLSRLIPSLARNSHGQHDPSPIRAVCISGGNRNGIRGIQITGYLDPYTDPVSSSMGFFDGASSEDTISPRFRFTLMGAPNFKVDSEFFIHLCTSLPLEDVEILVAKNFLGRSTWGRDVWTMSFAHCRRVETLQVIRNSASSSFTDALFHNVNAQSAQVDPSAVEADASEILFPNLRYLTLDRTILPATVMECLSDALMRRCDIGVQLDAILVLGGSVTKQYVTVLSEIVPEVQLNHVQMEFEEEDANGVPRSPTVVNRLLTLSSNFGGAQPVPVPPSVLDGVVEFDMPSLESVSDSSEESVSDDWDDDLEYDHNSVLSESDLEVEGMHAIDLFGPALQEVDALLDGGFDPDAFGLNVNQQTATLLTAIPWSPF